ncbi:MAG: hypothetical protein K6F02_07130, partial [Prevotella sp.]|nr:hypothetical protein [Prevotella sp.]
MEILTHLFINLLIAYTDDIALNVLFPEFSFLISQADLCIGNVNSKTGWIECQDLLAFCVLNPFIVYLVVMTVKNDIKTWYFAGNAICGIFLGTIQDQSAFFSTMEKTYYQIGMFYFTYLFYPFLGTTDHLVE